jgi:uncharacterized protein (TIGR02266 family)
MRIKRKRAAQGTVNQRVHQRVSCEAEVTFDSEHNFYLGLSENISEGGIFVATFQPAEIGAVLELTLRLPGAPSPFQVRAQVQWVREHTPENRAQPPGIGLKFIEPPPDLIAAVRTFIARREPAFYE